MLMLTIIWPYEVVREVLEKGHFIRLWSSFERHLNKKAIYSQIFGHIFCSVLNNLVMFRTEEGRLLLCAIVLAILLILILFSMLRKSLDENETSAKEKET